MSSMVSTLFHIFYDTCHLQAKGCDNFYILGMKHCGQCGIWYIDEYICIDMGIQLNGITGQHWGEIKIQHFFPLPWLSLFMRSFVCFVERISFPTMGHRSFSIFFFTSCWHDRKLVVACCCDLWRSLKKRDKRSTSLSRQKKYRTTKF